MAIDVISVKCPSCGANLSVEEGKDSFYCQYCGTKIVISNENEHIYRNIDEARIKEAETDRMVRMRELDIEEKDSGSKKVYIIVWLVAIAALVIPGVIGLMLGNDKMELCLLLAFLLGMFGFMKMMVDEKGNKKTKRAAGPNEVKISPAMVDIKGKNFNNVLLLFKSAGFTNVQLIPLNDLTLRSIKKNGWVETVTINGNDYFEVDEIVRKDAVVLITYHCMAQKM